MSEDVVVEAPPIGSTDRPGVTVVTGENFNAYVEQELGTPAGAEPVDENADPDAVAGAELAKLEEEKKAKEEAENAPKEGDIQDGKVFFRGKFVPKHDFNYRLHIKTEEIKKDFEHKTTAAEAAAKTEREARETAQRERDELKAKYEPPKSNEVGAEPLPSQFQDINEYSKALKEWAADKTRADDALAQAEVARVEAQKVAAKAWASHLTATKAELPDYAEKVSASPVQVSNELRDAILESDVGPKVLYHFAEHPEVAAELGKMSVKSMLKEFGRLEEKLGSADKPQTKSEKTPVAEISKAPAPITPLRGANAPAGVKIDAKGEYYGTFEQFKSDWNAGRIK